MIIIIIINHNQTVATPARKILVRSGLLEHANIAAVALKDWIPVKVSIPKRTFTFTMMLTYVIMLLISLRNGLHSTENPMLGGSFDMLLGLLFFSKRAWNSFNIEHHIFYI